MSSIQKKNTSCNCVYNILKFDELPAATQSAMHKYLKSKDRWMRIPCYTDQRMQDAVAKKNYEIKEPALYELWLETFQSIYQLIVAMHNTRFYKGVSILKPYLRSRTRAKLREILGKNVKISGLWKNMPLFKREFQERRKLCKLTPAETKEISKNWDPNEISEFGSLGVSYEGVWGNQNVFLDKLDVFVSENQEENRFRNFLKTVKDISVIHLSHHPNILTLLGYGPEYEAPSLIYRSTLMGTLKQNLLYPEPDFGWNNRIKIARGIAEGLYFLHKSLDHPVYHGNLQSCNVHLDQSYEPKLRNFGIAWRNTEEMNDMSELFPYLPGEFMRTKKISTKVDSFSYGIILYELATGLSAFSNDKGLINVYIENKIKEDYENIQKLYDVRVEELDITMFTKLIEWGRDCTKDDEKERATIYDALQGL